MSADLYWIEERIDAYIAGRLSPAERAVFESLMAADPAARAFVERHVRAVERLRSLPVAEPPVGFADRVAARASAAPRRRTFRLGALAELPTPALFAILFAVAVAVFAPMVVSSLGTAGEEVTKGVIGYSRSIGGDVEGGGVVVMVAVALGVAVWFGRRGIAAAARAIGL